MSERGLRERSGHAGGPGAPRAWVLNLDAEHELGARGRYAPTAHVAALVARERARLVGTLVRPGDVLVTEESLARANGAPHPAAGLEGRAWSPTPRALALLAAAGARAPEAPALAVLRRANARAFAALVRAPLAAASFAKRVAASLEEALALLAQAPPPLPGAAGGWLVRRAFGAAGRARRRIAPGAPDAAERAWLAAGLRQGPLVVEPWVAVVREHTRCAWVAPGGAVAIAPPAFQETTREGAWVQSVPAERGALARAEDARLEQAVEHAGRALAAIGYAGPFGIDAFSYRGARGPALNPLSEINARYTMDWPAGAPDAPAERRDPAAASR